MKTLTKLRNFLTAALLICSVSAFAQSITGPTSITQGATGSYSWTGPANSQYVNFAYGTLTVTGGVIVESNSTTLQVPYSKIFSVRWTGAPGAGKISVVYYQHITPPQSNPFLAGPYSKELNVTIGQAPVAGLSGKQSVTIGENAIYSWNFVPPAANATFSYATLYVVGGVFTENNSTTLAVGPSKNANVRWNGPVGSGSVRVSYTFRVGPFGPINFYETVTQGSTLNVSIAGTSSGCFGSAGNNGLATVSGNQCSTVGLLESYTWKFIQQSPLTFTGATVVVTGGIIVENNSTSMAVGVQKSFSVRWTTAGAGKVTVNYNFSYPNGGTSQSAILNVSVASSLRAAEMEITESEIATENLIYPNPATAGSEVFINNAGTSVEKVIVRNLEGQEQRATVTVGEKISIATAGMSKGMYVVQVISAEGKSTTHKFSVE
jgi:hypothetical protein